MKAAFAVAMAGAALLLAGCEQPHTEIPGSHGAIDDPVRDGAEIYRMTCVSCHGPDGAGIASLNPPLDRSPLLNGDPARLSALMLNGLRGPVEVNGATYHGLMPMWKDTFSDAQIAAVATYTRQAWSNESAPIAATLVARVRRELREKNSFFTAEELQAFGK